MVKRIILSATAESAVEGGEFLKQGASGGVVPNDTAASEIGIALSDADASAITEVGVIKQGIVRVTAVAATYAFGDQLEVATGGQSVQALSAGTLVGTAAESKTLAAPGELLVYINLA